MLKFLKNFILLSISTGIINIIEVITNAYITQKIGTTILGTYSLIGNLFNFLVTISLFGVPLAITKIVSEKDELSDNNSIIKASKIGYRLCAIISIIICILTIIFKNTICKFFLKNIDDDKIIILLALSLPFIAISSCICGYFNSLRKVNKPVIHEFISHIVRSFILVLLIFLNKKTYLAFGISILLSEILSFIYCYISYKKDIKKLKVNRNTQENTLNITKKILKISAPISFTSFVRSGLSTLKHTLIPIRLQKYGFSYDYALSRYGIIHGIALPFVLMPSIFINCLSSLLLPEYSRLFAINNLNKIQKATEKIFKIILTLSLYISFILYISSDLLCYLIYKNTVVAYYVKILTPLVCIIYIDYIVDNILRGLDLQVKVMKINIIDVITSILLIYFGVPYLGTFGYILVIYVSEYLNGLLSIKLLLKKIDMKFKFYDWILRPCTILFISFFISIKVFPNIENIACLILNIILFTTIFILLYFIPNLLKKK
jgi:stage V sporulation protein B